MESAKGIFSDAVVLNLSLSCLGTTRKLASTEYEVKADKSLTSASKFILQCPELDAIHELLTEVRQWIKARTIKSGIKGGLLIMRLSLVPQMYEYVERAQVRLVGLVSRFCEVYEAVKARDSLSADEGGLGPLFKESDYPALSKVSSLFSLRCDPIEIGAPGSLRTISQQAYDKAAAACQSDFQNALDMAKSLLFEELSGIVEHMAQILTPGADGKRKKFKDSSVETARQFFDNFDFRNFSDDKELSKLVDKMRAALKGASPEDLRKDETVKARVRAAAESVKASLAELVTTAPGRAISFDDNWGDL